MSAAAMALEHVAAWAWRASWQVAGGGAPWGGAGRRGAAGSFDWARMRVWATWAWASGVVLLAGRVVWASARLARTVRRMPVLTDPRVLGVLRACCAEAGVRRV